MFLKLILIGHIFSAFAWDYYKKGPDAWPQLYDNCNGKEQSPIDIITDNVLYNTSLPNIRFVNYDYLNYWNVTSDKTVTLAPIFKADSFAPKLYGGSNNNSETATLIQIHFHWGLNDYQGSEHLINGKKYPLEMHLVHSTNSKKLNVIGFLFQLTEEDNAILEELLDSVNKTRFKENNNHYAEFSILKLIGINNGSNTSQLNYFRYMGSLTTPPCSEGVVWTIITNCISISSKQLQIVRGLNLNFNHRQPQPIFNRKVYSNFRVNNKTGSFIPPPISLNFTQKLREFLFKIFSSIFN